MANIREVAERANVAKCTVSRVLNNSDKVSEKTRQKVLDAIKELDYTPNELARGMFKQKSGIIAMIVPSISHPFFSRMASYFEVELFKRGYRLMFCSSKGSSEREKSYLNVFKTNIVDGIIFGASNLEKEIYESFQKPLVMLDKYLDADLTYVTADHQQGGVLAANAFIKSGCKHVIHLGDVTPKNILSYQSHVELHRVLTEHHILSEEIDLPLNDYNFNMFYDFAMKILQEDPTIDGMLGADMPAAAFLKAGIHLGKKIPDELAIIGYDGTYVANINTVAMTTIVQPLDEIAKEATELLFRQIDGKKIESKEKTVKIAIRQGETTK